MTECIISFDRALLSLLFSAFACLLARWGRKKKNCIRRGMKMKQNRKVLFFNFITSNSIHALKNAITQTDTPEQNELPFHDCVFVRCLLSFCTQAYNVWNGKIKSPFFAYCIGKKKQLISLLQTFNTVPPDNTQKKTQAGERKSFVVKL